MLPENADQPLVFFGSKEYVPLFAALTRSVKGQKMVFYNSKQAPLRLDACRGDLKRAREPIGNMNVLLPFSAATLCASERLPEKPACAGCHVNFVRLSSLTIRKSLVVN
jgi:hypothetical protein